MRREEGGGSRRCVMCDVETRGRHEVFTTELSAGGHTTRSTPRADKFS